MRKSPNLLVWSLVNLGVGILLVYFEALVIVICSGEFESMIGSAPLMSGGVAIAIIAVVEVAYIVSIFACLINGIFNQYARFRTPGTIISIVCIIREMIMIGSLVTAIAEFLA